MRQQDIVLEHLKKHKSITSWEAITEYNITRLAEMIRRIKNDGHTIKTDLENGKKTHFARYTLLKGQ